MEGFDNHSLEGGLGLLLKNATIRRFNAIKLSNKTPTKSIKL